MQLIDLPNLGPHNVELLEKAGVSNSDELRLLGAENAWLKMKAFDPGLCLHALTGLEGAIQGIPKKDISPERKEELRVFFNAEQ